MSRREHGRTPAPAGLPARAAPDEPLVRVSDLAVRFPIPRGLRRTLARSPQLAARAVDGVSFDLSSGEMLALVGESGCGKTTTAQAVLRLIEPHSGVVHFDGEDITHAKASRVRGLRRRMQMIYQDPYESLNPRFRVRDVVAELLRVQGVTNDRETKVQRAMVASGLTPPDLFLGRRPHELSGGQRQRVAIAASLVLEPDLLVADEPVSMLDVSVRAGVLAVLDGLRRSGIAVLMITHDLSTAAHFADRIAVMYLGRIVELGAARAVVGDPQHPYTRALISVVPDPDPRRPGAAQILSGEAPDVVHIPAGCRFHPRCPVRTEGCDRHDPSLRQVSRGAAGHEAACVLV